MHMPSVFISFSWADLSFCEKLYQVLKDANFDVWFAPQNMKGGGKIINQISHAVKSTDKVLLILSESSIKSNWVETEIRKARKREKDENKSLFFPIKLCSMDLIKEWELFDSDSGQDLAVEIREYFIPDFLEWDNPQRFSETTKKLIEDLKDS